MKDYVRQIIRLFSKNAYEEDIVKEVHLWLVDDDKSNQKREALRQIWDDCEGETNINIQSSLKSVYHKVGADHMSVHYAWYRYAAVIAIFVVSILSTYFFTLKYSNEDVAVIDKYTRSGEILNTTLPDGTLVQTNAETLLIYPEQFTGSHRTVFVLGEANFKVKPNPEKPFVVRANNMDITALGTEFNVSSYAENQNVTVTLLEGKVGVVCGDDRNKYILYPGQQVSYNKNTHASKLMSANVDDVTAWQRGIMVFRSATLKEVFNVLSRKFGVEFQYNESRMSKDKFNFKFSSSASLEEILEMIQMIVGDCHYQLKGDICVVK